MWRTIIALVVVISSLGISVLPAKPAFAAGAWTTKAPMPAARSVAAAAVINDVLYVAGGHDGVTGGTTTLQAYNPTTNTWSTLAPMPYRRYSGNGAGVINGELYVAGGWNWPDSGFPQSSLFVYNPGTNSWRIGASMPTLSGNGASGVINGKLYVTTAANGSSGWRNFLHVYDPANDTWISLASSPNDHVNPAFGVIDNKFYVAGGDSDNGVHAVLDVYDPATNTWTTKASMPAAGSGFASAVLDGKLYSIGGSVSGSLSSVMYVYDPQADTWTTQTSMPTARSGAAGGVINGVIYVAGGQGITTLATVEAFTVTAPPAAPTDLTKISTDNNPLPAFKWNAVAGNVTYEVKMDSGNWTDVGDKLTYVQPSVLSEASHTFSVRAKDAGGNTGIEASLSFSVTATANLANTRIAFPSIRDGNLEIYSMNADGSGETRLTNNPADDLAPAWSPDGTKIAFSSNRSGNHEVYVMNSDGSGQTKLTSNGAGNALLVYPAWSPDGAKIAFSSYRYNNNNSAIYVMDADGSNQTLLAIPPFQSDAQPLWSPDGAKIAFFSNRTGGNNWQIYVMNAGGSNQTQLTTAPPNNSAPSWLPDGSKIVFNSYRDGNWEIYAMNADGSGQTNLTNNGADDGTPTWSPDGTKIAFYSSRSGTQEVHVMNANGSNVTRLTTNSLAVAFPAWSPFLASVSPTVATADADNIATTSARLNGNLGALGTASTVSVSFQWGTSSGNYTGEIGSQSMTATGAFSASLTGLSAGTTYYFRAKAVGNGTSYGAERSFTTTNITHTITASAGANGAISPSGAVVVNQGASQSFSITPNTGYHIADMLVDGSSVGAVASYTFSNVTANHTIAASFAITNQSPFALFTFSPETPPVNQKVTFNASATYDPDGTIVSYQWNFGDEGTASGQIVEHTYSAAGDYTVTLTVQDNNGATNAKAKPITVTPPPPTPPAGRRSLPDPSTFIMVGSGLAVALFYIGFSGLRRRLNSG